MSIISMLWLSKSSRKVGNLNQKFPENDKSHYSWSDKHNILLVGSITTLCHVCIRKSIICILICYRTLSMSLLYVYDLEGATFPLTRLGDHIKQIVNIIIFVHGRFVLFKHWTYTRSFYEWMFRLPLPCQASPLPASSTKTLVRL